MEIQVMSDLHFEFLDDQHAMAEYRASFPVLAETLVLAGDVAYSHQLNFVLGLFASDYKDIICVVGNHECWYTDIASCRKTVNSVTVRYPNIHYLDNSSAIIGGQRFIGGTLWFPDHPLNTSYENRMNDFGFIKQFRNTVYDENTYTIKYLNNNVAADDIVVTHYLPHEGCVSERYRGDPVNCFFVCPMDDCIMKNAPKLWIHGHTHTPVDCVINNTRIIANPIGYIHDQNNNVSRVITV